MNEPKKVKRTRKPLGQPIERTDEELDALVSAQPTADEIQEMIERTRRISPLAAALMEAKEEEENDGDKQP